jgi:hypothetical protein
MRQKDQYSFYYLKRIFKNKDIQVNNKNMEESKLGYPPKPKASPCALL